MQLRAAATAFFIASVVPAGPIAELPKADVVVARRAPASATLVWNATNRVTDLTARPITPSDGERAIAVDAVKLLASRAPSLRSTFLTVRVVYVLSRQQLVYGNATMADKGPLVEVTALRRDVLRDASQWEKELQAGRPTPGLSVKRLGRFPTAY